MERIDECDSCPHDGKCQYQDLSDCQCCEVVLSKELVVRGSND